MFTILDFSINYYFMKLDESSSFLTKFNTPFGRFRFTRMPSGFTVTRATFPCKLDTIFNNLDF